MKPTHWTTIDADTALADLATMATELRRLGLPSDNAFGIDMAVWDVRYAYAAIDRLHRLMKEQAK